MSGILHVIVEILFVVLSMKFTMNVVQIMLFKHINMRWQGGSSGLT